MTNRGLNSCDACEHTKLMMKKMETKIVSQNARASALTANRKRISDAMLPNVQWIAL